MNIHKVGVYGCLKYFYYRLLTHKKIILNHLNCNNYHKLLTQISKSATLLFSFNTEEKHKIIITHIFYSITRKKD